MRSSEQEPQFSPNLPPAGRLLEERPQYIGIPLENFNRGALVNCQLYLKVDKEKFIKYSDPNTPFDQQARGRLTENGHKFVFVKREDSHHLNRYFEENLLQTLADPGSTDEQRAQALYGTSVHIMRELMMDPAIPETVRSCRRISEKSIQHIIATPSALSMIMDLASVDYYTFTHSVNVMTYSVALASRLGYPPGEILVDLGQSALVHDVGKSYVDWKITNKSGPLTPDEFEVMKQHPDYGYKALASTKEIPENTLHAVLHHHEKLDGKGYPHGLVGGQIDLNVRIITCSDIYDALTTRRVYRPAMKSFPALQLMKEWVGTDLDESVYKAFVKMLGDL